MLAKIRSLFRSGSADPGKAAAVRHVRPMLESLEERAVPAAGIDAGSLSLVDAVYLMSSAQGNQAEIIIGNYAQQVSSNPAVQAFGQKLVHDHTLALQQEQSLFSQLGLPMPPPGQDQIEELQSYMGKTGLAFDAQFTVNMIVDHQKDLFIGMVEQNLGSNASVKAFDAAQTPVLENHYDTAVSIAESLINSFYSQSGQNNGGQNNGGSNGSGTTGSGM